MQRAATLLVIAVVATAGCEKRDPNPAASAAPPASSALAPSPLPSASAQKRSSGRLRQLSELTSDGGVSFTEFALSLPETTGPVWVARIELSKSQLSVVQAKTPRPLLKIVAGKLPEGDHVAINGSFYGRDDRPMGWVVSGKRQLAPKTRSGGSGIFLLEGSAARIVHRDVPLPKALPDVALQSIDRLVDAGQSVVRPRPGMRRDARSAVAVRADGSVLFIVAFDARAADMRPDSVVALNAQSTSTGLTLAEFATLMAQPRAQGGLGVKTALNLDGGFSTSMLVDVGGQKRSLLPHRATTNALVASPR